MLTPRPSLIGVLLIGGAELHSLRAQLEEANDNRITSAQRNARGVLMILIWPLIRMHSQTEVCATALPAFQFPAMAFDGNGRSVTSAGV